MDEQHEAHAIVPERLKRKTIQTMSFDTPYYVLAESEAKETIWADKETGCLRAYSDMDLDEEDQKASKAELSDRIAIMKAEVFDADGNLRQGLIADLRYTDPGLIDVGDDSPPTDQEELDEWMDYMKVVIDFVAIATSDNGKLVTLSGDAIYYDSLRYLMQQTDALTDDLDKDDEEVDTPEQKNKVKAVLSKIAALALRR